MNEPGRPAKLDWSLLPLWVLEPVIRVLMFGARKHSPDGWQRVPDAKREYFSALMRHLAEWQAGEKADAETGESHLDHALCDLIIIRWHEAKDKMKRPERKQYFKL